ncbi:MAG: cytidylate kinase-like family protein [Nitrososphaerota archaeon]|nr:cytidylate kinase-like family protein [Candidatus Bathyarchaeota archaeon]MDW8049347.1 cytidylate kinase-like family protein [Nitrososphaerota archaeon]
MIIALSGELGAGCTEVATILSTKLGINFINSAAIIKSIVVEFRGVHPTESFMEFEQHVASGEIDLDKMIRSKIDELIKRGDLIIEGRSAFMLLDKPNVFKVLLVAPKEKRVRHIAKARNITIEEAEEAIRVSDSERKHMVEKLFKKDWLDPNNYDLVINTGTRTHEEAADLILYEIGRMKK